LFEDSAHYDIGLYDYASGVRRIRLGESIPLDVHARVLADDLRDGNYDRIVLIGHSMGGLLCKAVIKHLIDSRAGANGLLTIERVAGLFLIATPQAGSLRVPRFLANVSKDVKVLGAHSEFVKEINRRFNDTLCLGSKNRLEATDKFVIPTYAVVATGDIWVDEFSSALNLPSDQIKHIWGSHGAIVKPESREDGFYSWIRHKIDDCFTASAPAAHPHWPVIRSTAGASTAAQSPISNIDTAIRNLMELVANYSQTGGLDIDMNISINLNIVPQEGSS
jgi:pimeloyl-ACP methyl ester carboxylesterase